MTTPTPASNKELNEAVIKLCNYYNEFIDHLNKGVSLDDEFASEVSNYLGNEFPPVFFNAPPEEAGDCIQAITDKFEIHFAVNILTDLVLYALAPAPLDPYQSIDITTTIWDRLK